MSFFKNLFGHDEAQNAHNQVYGGDSSNYDTNDNQGQQHKSSFTHEAIAGAAGFAALKAYEDHVRRSGEQVSHPMMKEMLAGFAAAEVDKLFETKGLDYLDREKAKEMAVHQAHKLANEKYGPGQVYQGGNSGGGGGNSYQQGAGGDGGYQQNRGNDYGQGGGDDQNRDNDYGQGGGDYQNRGNNYGQGGGDNQNYGNQDQQWGGGDGDQQQSRPEHHRHQHRREEDD